VPVAVAVLLLPPVAIAAVLAPTAIAPLNNPSDVAVAPLPVATAKLFAPLLQPAPPAVKPLIDAQVAAAAPAPHSAVTASPEATAPSRIPPASLFPDIALWLPTWVPSLVGLTTHTRTVSGIEAQWGWNSKIY